MAATKTVAIPVLANVTHTVWARTIQVSAPLEMYFNAEQSAELARKCEEAFARAAQEIKASCPGVEVRWR